MRSFRFTRPECELFARREALSPSLWASRNIIVQDGLYAGSPVRMDVSPYLPGILDMYARRGVEEVVVCGSPQTGKTLLLYICLGWAMDYRPGTKMLTMPTKDTRDRVKKEKLVPLLRGSPALRRQIAKVLNDNIALKNGTHIWLSTAESPSQRASITVQDLFLDEEDLYGSSGAGEPVEDFKGRTRSLGGRAKIMRVSQVKGDIGSSIWRALTGGVDQLYCYETRCPACWERHLPDLGNLVVEEGGKDPLSIRRRKLGRYKCPRCGYLWSDYARDLAVSGGGWAPYSYSEERGFEPLPPGEEIKEPRAAGFHLPAVLARSVSLSSLAARRILAEASDDATVKMQFANDELGLPYSPVELATDEERLLALRVSWLPPRAVPHGAVALTCGIDVQKRGYWYLVRAWMPSLASYIIDYGSLETWEHVATLIFDTYYPVLAPEWSGPEEGTKAASARSAGASPALPGEAMPSTSPEMFSGEVMPIWRAALDSGGTETEGVFTRTEEVYMWVRAHGGGVAHACKGASHSQTAYVRRVIRERLPHSGRPIPGHLPLYMLDTGSLKTIDFSRLLNPESSQPLRLHAGCGPDLAAQLSSERQVRRGGKLVWERKGGQNHLLDCLMLSAACADASWTPSLPLYVLQLRQAELARNEAPMPAPKKRERPEPARRWG
ncbi:MAG: phage terminase large subunit family protein [Deltaproteobacteria bacterium]|jgi:phage terminase large subunit GpA-like protein|nr:phage terminase large subunit family protein [Deltaproteobacteria bacterium]